MVMKCMCLINGAYFNGSRLRKGEIFYIRAKKGKRDKDSGLFDIPERWQDIKLTEKQQFSDKWMLKMDDPINEEEDQEHNDAIYKSEVDASKVIKKLAKNVISEEEEEETIDTSKGPTKKKVKAKIEEEVI